MKLSISLATAFAGLFLSTGVANAASITFSFDPNQLLDNAPTRVDLRASQQDPRLIIGSRQTLSGVSRTYFTGRPGDTAQPKELNAYTNWRDGLNSVGEGITAFNLWITTAGYANNPHDSVAAGSWNQRLYRDGSNGNAATGIIATAADGWTASVSNVYGDTYGVTWRTTDRTRSLRPTSLGGLDISAFTFTMDDTNAVAGDSYRLWLNATNGGPGAADNGLVFDANGWGTRTTTTAPFAAKDGTRVGTEGSVWQGVIDVTAEETTAGRGNAVAVPEPTTFALFVPLVLATLRRRL